MKVSIAAVFAFVMVLMASSSVVGAKSCMKITIINGQETAVGCAVAQYPKLPKDPVTGEEPRCELHSDLEKAYPDCCPKYRCVL